MNASVRILMAVIAAGSAALPLPALSADYDPPIVVDQPVEEVPIEVGSGWYLRGDIGYNFQVDADGNFDYRTFDALTGVYSDNTFASGSLNKQVTWSAGVGYNFTDMLRADVTVEGFRMNFDGTTASGAPCVDPVAFPAYAGTGCRSEDSSTASAIGVMANGYVDLGTYVGLTPYVGAGLGYTYVDWGSLGDTVLCVGPTCPAALVSVTEHEGDQSWRFTYALMAGLAYDVSQNLKLDLGYRYRHIDGGSMFGFDPATIAAGAVGTQGEDPGFTSHEVRVGLRYALW
jgi:opacity protein-like surface antigen